MAPPDRQSLSPSNFDFNASLPVSKLATNSLETQFIGRESCLDEECMTVEVVGEKDV